MVWSCTSRQPPSRLYQRWSEGPEAPPPPLAGSLAGRHRVPKQPPEVGAVRTCCPGASRATTERDRARESEAAPPAEPAGGKRTETMAARAPGRAGRSAWGRPQRSPPAHTCAGRPAEGRGQRARRAALGALDASPPRRGPGAERSPGGNPSLGPRRGARGNPCGRSRGRGAGLGSLRWSLVREAKRHEVSFSSGFF